MRIIAGRFKGTRLSGPRGDAVRPTTDRVREALFSALGDRVQGCAVLDLFAGTGAFGLEAVSRGAESALFVEKDRRTAAGLAKTIQRLGIEDRVSILIMDAIRAIKVAAGRNERFGIVFLDPPYGKGRLSRVLTAPEFRKILEPDGLIIVEREQGSECPNGLESTDKQFSRRYGSTLIEIFRHKQDGL